MTFVRKPKNLQAFVSNMNAAEAHSWESADAVQGIKPTVSAQGRDIAERRRLEAQRKTVGSYGQSQLANHATSQRGAVSRFTQKRRDELQSRLEYRTETLSSDSRRLGDQKHTMSTTPTKLSDRPLPDATLYQKRPF